jgi:hypothetical protein
MDRAELWAHLELSGNDCRLHGGKLVVRLNPPFKNPDFNLAGTPLPTLPAAMQSSDARISRSAATPLPDAPAWDEAFLRVESYLRAHHLESRVLLNHLATGIIREARERPPANPAEEPVTATMHATHARIGAWFARAGNGGDWSQERVRVRGRLALVLADVPGRWAHCFLAAGPVPPELAAALASCVLQPGPGLRFSNMPSTPLEFGFDNPGSPNSRHRGAWMIVRASASWLSIVGLFGVAWAASH